MKRITGILLASCFTLTSVGAFAADTVKPSTAKEPAAATDKSAPAKDALETCKKQGKVGKDLDACIKAQQTPAATAAPKPLPPPTKKGGASGKEDGTHK